MGSTLAYLQGADRTVVQCTLVLIANPFHTLGISPKQYRFLARNLGMMALGEWVHSRHKTDRIRVIQKLLSHKRSNPAYASYSKTKHEHMGRKFFHSRLSGLPMPNCWTCSQALQPNWANCPFCGAEGVDKNQCPQCEKHVDNSWEFCPNCGYTKGSGHSKEITPNAITSGFGATQPVTQTVPVTQYTPPMNPQPPIATQNQTITSQNWQEFDSDPAEKKSGFNWVWFLFILLIIIARIGAKSAARGGF